jgi:hypothetical protein
VDGLRNLISNSKASGAVKKLLPSVVTSSMIGGGGGSAKTSSHQNESELDKVEKRFADLKTVLVEKCQSSKL